VTLHAKVFHWIINWNNMCPCLWEGTSYSNAPITKEHFSHSQLSLVREVSKGCYVSETKAFDWLVEFDRW